MLFLYVLVCRHIIKNRKNVCLLHRHSLLRIVVHSSANKWFPWRKKQEPLFIKRRLSTHRRNIFLERVRQRKKIAAKSKYLQTACKYCVGSILNLFHATRDVMSSPTYSCCTPSTFTAVLKRKIHYCSITVIKCNLNLFCCKQILAFLIFPGLR